MSHSRRVLNRAPSKSVQQSPSACSDRRSIASKPGRELYECPASLLARRRHTKSSLVHQSLRPLRESGLPSILEGRSRSVHTSSLGIVEFEDGESTSKKPPRKQSKFVANIAVQRALTWHFRFVPPSSRVLFGPNTPHRRPSQPLSRLDLGRPVSMANCEQAKSTASDLERILDTHRSRCACRDCGR